VAPSSRFQQHILGNKGHGIAACTFSKVAVDPSLEELQRDLQNEHSVQEAAIQRQQHAASKSVAAAKAGFGQQSILHFANAGATEEAHLRLMALIDAAPSLPGVR
jgi:hypothetical protein